MNVRTRITRLRSTFACLSLSLALSALAAPPAAAATAVRQPNGAIRYYDDRGQDRGYAWCLRRTERRFGGWSDCSYYTFEQCRMASGGFMGYCEPNPFSFEVAPPPPRKRR